MVILDYLSGPSAIMRVLKSDRGKRGVRVREGDGGKGWSDVIAGFEEGRGPQAKECGQP